VPDDIYDDYRTVIRYGPVEAIGVSVSKTWDMSIFLVKMVGRMITGEASVKNLSGPISIAQTAGKSASYGFAYFVKFLALVSISLGVLNLLPIPVLDGGHLFFFLIEAIKGSPLSEQAQLQGQKIGMILLLALMALAFYVDIARLLG
jgi:regulator of sigma E protease